MDGFGWKSDTKGDKGFTRCMPLKYVGFVDMNLNYSFALSTIGKTLS